MGQSHSQEACGLRRHVEAWNGDRAALAQFLADAAVDASFSWERSGDSILPCSKHLTGEYEGSVYYLASLAQGMFPADLDANERARRVERLSEYLMGVPEELYWRLSVEAVESHHLMREIVAAVATGGVYSADFVKASAKGYTLEEIVALERGVRAAFTPDECRAFNGSFKQVNSLFKFITDAEVHTHSRADIMRGLVERGYRSNAMVRRAMRASGYSLSDIRFWPELLWELQPVGMVRL